MGPVDEFVRKKARNDYTVLALWETGIRTLRLPLADLTDEIFLKPARGSRNLKIAILNRYIAGDFVEQLLVSLLGAEERFLESLNLRDVRRDLKHQLRLVVSVSDGGCMHHHREFTAVGIDDGLFCPQPQSGSKGLCDRTSIAFSGNIFIDHPAVAADGIS